MRFKKIEFGVHAAEASGARARVSGRCYSGPIDVGDVFSAVYELVVQPKGEEYGPSLRSKSQLVDIEVKAITAYGRSLSTLDTGMTAELLLSGNGIDAIKPGYTLGYSIGDTE